MNDFPEIFALVAGLVFIVLQIKQNNWMWLFNILGSSAVACVFFSQRLWADFALNSYYVLMSFWGIYAWIRDSKKTDAPIHLRTIKTREWVASFLIALACLSCIPLLRFLGDSAPVIDTVIAITGILGTWWCANSHSENWILWIAGNALSTWLCFSRGLNYMAILYFVYIFTSIWGYANWVRKGGYIRD